MQPFRKDPTNYEDLKFLVQERGASIPKTIIYADSIPDGSSVGDYLRLYFKMVGWSYSELTYLIRAFNDEVGNEEREILIQELKKRDSRVRIFIASNALEMGVNHPDITYVIQWGVPRSGLPSLVQRGGRVARAKDIKDGQLIFFLCT